MKSFRLKYLSVLSAIVGIMTFVFSVNAEEWKLHPSFDRTPLRIIDTPEDTYFLVHQQIYDKSKVGYDFPSLTLFRYNKNATDKGITPLVHDVQLSSADIRTADYSPKGEYLVIVYNDGGIDLIDKNRHLTYIDKLKRYTIPGMAKVTSVSFEPSTGDAWIGTDAGYMHVDAVSFTVQDVKVFDRGIDRICRFGDKLVALSENAAWQSNGINPLTFNEFKKISSVGSPSIMLPLGENEFAYVYGAPGSNSPINRVLKLARYDNSSWKVADLGQDLFYSLSNNGALINRYESNFIPNKDGYLIYSTSKAWQLYAPNDGESTRLVSISLDSNPISLGSWDFNNFWSYRDRGTFVARHADFTMDSNATSASATWTDMQDPIRPDAPAAFICTYMDYSPKYGMLVMNHGIERGLPTTVKVNPILLSGYEEQWDVYSSAYEAPYTVENNEDLNKIYLNNINSFPVPDPIGIAIDPIYPDWACSGSMFGGFVFQNISNLKNDIIKFCSPNDPFATFPGVYPIMPLQTWGTSSGFVPPMYDKNNVLWTIFCNILEANGSSPATQIKFMVPENRKKLFNPDTKIDPNEMWGTIAVPFDVHPHYACKMLVCRHPKNQNLIIICLNEYNDKLIILDHKGTLEDTTDDEYLFFSKIKGKSGKISTFTEVNSISEDPITGNIIVALMDNTIMFNPNLAQRGDVLSGEMLQLAERTNEDIIPERCQVNKIIFDTEGRMWVGTHNQGVIGVDRERKKVFARYNTSNSIISSDCVYGLGWNAGAGSLMISTKLGLSEVFPDTKSVPKEKERPSLNISCIDPNYNGYVEIRNLSPNQNIIIKDADGIEVRRLNNGNFRNIEWNLKNNKDEIVKAGIYSVDIDNQNSIDLIIMSN